MNKNVYSDKNELLMIFDTWKPYGITTVDFIKDLKQKSGVNKITFSGRLDPLAQGVLKVLTDDDTKRSKELMASQKTYKFDMVLGIDTESHDCLSKVNAIKNAGDLTYTRVIKELGRYVNVYNEQEYPLVSSYVIRHNGIKNPLWWFYINGYRDIKLPKKNVEILEHKVIDICKLNTLDFAKKCINRIDTITTDKLKNELRVGEFKSQWDEILNNQCLEKTGHLIITLEMSVSSGFYIRRFCHDFGKYLGTYGIAFDITRTNMK